MSRVFRSSGESDRARTCVPSPAVRPRWSRRGRRTRRTSTRRRRDAGCASQPCTVEPDRVEEIRRLSPISVAVSVADAAALHRAAKRNLVFRGVS